MRRRLRTGRSCGSLSTEPSTVQPVFPRRSTRLEARAQPRASCTSSTAAHVPSSLCSHPTALRSPPFFLLLPHSVLPDAYPSRYMLLCVRAFRRNCMMHYMPRVPLNPAATTPLSFWVGSMLRRRRRHGSARHARHASCNCETAAPTSKAKRARTMSTAVLECMCKGVGRLAVWDGLIRSRCSLRVDRPSSTHALYWDDRCKRVTRRLPRAVDRRGSVGERVEWLAV